MWPEVTKSPAKTMAMDVWAWPVGGHDVANLWPFRGQSVARTRPSGGQCAACLRPVRGHDAAKAAFGTPLPRGATRWCSEADGHGGAGDGPSDLRGDARVVVSISRCGVSGGAHML